MQCPLEFPAVSALVSFSSVIGDRVGIRPKRCDDWTVIPNLWGAVIGPPGVLKTPAINEGLYSVKRLVANARIDYERAMKDWEFEGLKLDAEKKNLKDQLYKAVKDDDKEAINEVKRK